MGFIAVESESYTFRYVNLRAVPTGANCCVKAKDQLGRHAHRRIAANPLGEDFACNVFWKFPVVKPVYAFWRAVLRQIGLYQRAYGIVQIGGLGAVFEQPCPRGFVELAHYVLSYVVA